MGTWTAYPDSSANDGRKAPKSLKAYNAPQFKILTPEQAIEKFRAEALPGDVGAQKLLRIAEGLCRQKRE